jgi:hypothetical protein
MDSGQIMTDKKFRVIVITFLILTIRVFELNRVSLKLSELIIPLPYLDLNNSLKYLWEIQKRTSPSYTLFSFLCRKGAKGW